MPVAAFHCFADEKSRPMVDLKLRCGAGFFCTMTSRNLYRESWVPFQFETKDRSYGQERNLSHIDFGPPGGCHVTGIVARLPDLEPPKGSKIRDWTVLTEAAPFWKVSSYL